MRLRKLMAHIIGTAVIIGVNYYVCKFTALYGYSMLKSRGIGGR